MTLFVIILFIWLVAYGMKSTSDKMEHHKYIKDTTTNAKEQYDYCCNRIEEFAREYRKEASQIKIEKYFNKNLNSESNYLFPQTPWNIDFQHNKEYNCLELNNYDEFKNLETIINNKAENISQRLVPNYDIEKIWLTFTALACGISLRTNYMSYIYKNDIWDDIPLNVGEINLSSWQKKYKNAPQDSATLLHYLNISVFYKRFILKEIMYWDTDIDETGNSYEVYSNPDILEKIAKNHNLPTSSELEKGWSHSPYENISDIVLLESRKYIKEKGYMPVNLGNITPYPTQRDKEKNYSIKSLRESSEDEQKYDIRKKHPYI